MVSSTSALKYYTKYTFVKHEHPHELTTLVPSVLEGQIGSKQELNGAGQNIAGLLISFLIMILNPKKVEALDQNDDVHRVGYHSSF